MGRLSPDEVACRALPLQSVHWAIGSSSLNPVSCVVSYHAQISEKNDSGPEALGLADELGLVEAEGEILAEADADGLDDGDSEGDGLRLDEGEALALGLRDGLSLGLTDADGL